MLMDKRLRDLCKLKELEGKKLKDTREGILYSRQHHDHGGYEVFAMTEL